ncbi:hypothetical protein D3C87_1520480 [compost metagenome]
MGKRLINARCTSRARALSPWALSSSARAKSWPGFIVCRLVRNCCSARTASSRLRRASAWATNSACAALRFACTSASAASRLACASASTASRLRCTKRGSSACFTAATSAACAFAKVSNAAMMGPAFSTHKLPQLPLQYNSVLPADESATGGYGGFHSDTQGCALAPQFA